MSETVCGYEKEDGGRCGTTFGLCEEGDCGFCYAHCPHRQEERDAARKRGGYAAANGKGTIPPDETPAPPETLEDAKAWNAWAAYAVVVGNLDSAKGNTCVRLLTEFRKCLEREEAAEKFEEYDRKFERFQAAIERGEKPDLKAL